MSKILIIDDDPDIIETSSLILHSAGFAVSSANNPETGYKAIKEQNPDLIILDVMMDEPDDGFYLAQKLRKEGIKTPIIMYTAVSKATGMKYQSNELIPVDEFIEKPVAAEELIKKVNFLLGVNKVGV